MLDHFGSGISCDHVQVGYRVGSLCINILDEKISFRGKLLVIFWVRKGYVIGVSSSLQIVIDPKCHADAFTRLHYHVVARIPTSISMSARSSRSPLTAGSGARYFAASSKGTIARSADLRLRAERGLSRFESPSACSWFTASLKRRNF
jgi:hypothetical protein